MRSIYKFFVDVGRHGDIEATFTADAETIDFAIGKTVCFYEPWVKHYGCTVTLEPDMFSIVSSDPQKVATFDEVKLSPGENPLGLLCDFIADGRVELTLEEAEKAPPYFKKAVETQLAMKREYEKYVQAGKPNGCKQSDVFWTQKKLGNTDEKP